MTADQMFKELTLLSDSWDDEHIVFRKDLLFGYLIGLEKMLQNTSSNSDYAKCQKLINMMVGAYGIKDIENEPPAVRLEYCLHRLQESRGILRQLNKHFA